VSGSSRVAIVSFHIIKSHKVIAIILKPGRPQSERADDDYKVRQIVEELLGSIESRGDAAVRQLSEKFDNWSPASFVLSEQEIEHAMSKVAKQDLLDIEFAQKQVRNFAKHQRASMLDVEVETMPGNAFVVEAKRQFLVVSVLTCLLAPLKPASLQTIRLMGRWLLPIFSGKPNTVSIHRQC